MSDIRIDVNAPTHWQRTTGRFPYQWSLDAMALVAAYTGSTAHGTTLPSDDPHHVDDVDLMVVAVPPQRWTYGLHSWDHWVWQEGEAGPMDVVAYGLRKWVGLMLKSNPNVVGLLWLPQRCYLHQAMPFTWWLEARGAFLSKRIYASFCGYARSQLHGMATGPRGRAYMGRDRLLLVHRYGYDIKHAAHCVRLLRMGTEALTEGVLYVDRTGRDAEELMAIKRGEWRVERLVAETDLWQERMESAYQASALPEEPDERLAEDLLMRTFEHFWRYR